VQVNLLKLMEETEVNLHSQTDLIGQMQSMMELQRTGKTPRRTINTRHMLFIVSGAFDKLPDVIRQRLVAYRQQTEPLLEYYARSGLLTSVEGLGSIDEIFARIRAVLDALAGRQKNG